MTSKALYFKNAMRVCAPQGPFFISKVKFRWTSIKSFHDDTPVLLAAVEFVMDTFD